MSIYDFMLMRWERMQATKPKAREPWLLPYIRAIHTFPMDPVEEDGWISRIRGDKDLQRALVLPNGKPNDYTARFLESFYEWRLKANNQYSYITYGRLGLGKSTWLAILSKMVLNVFPEARNYVINSYDGLIQTMAECPNHSTMNFDEDIMPSGEESNNIKKYFTNETKFLRMKETNLNLSYKKRTLNETSNAYFEMCGFNEATEESRAVMFDPNGNCLGFVILKRNFDEIFFEPFKVAKEETFKGLLESGGIKPAFNSKEDEKFIDLFFDVLQKRGLLIKDISKITAFIRNYASESKLSIFEPTIKRVAQRLSVKMDELILNTKVGKVPISIDPNIVEQVGRRLAADGTFKRMKSVNSISNYIRSFCKDLVKEEQVKVVADLVYYKQKELHEISMTQTQEAMKIIREGDSWQDGGVAEDFPFFQRVLKHLDRLIPNSLARKGKMIETFRRKAYGESHDDVEKELDLGHGTVTNYMTEIQSEYLGYAGENAKDEELTEKKIPHLSQGKNTDAPDHLIYDQNGRIIEVLSQKTYLDFDFYKVTHEVGQREFEAAAANNCPLTLACYECRGFKWHTLRYQPSVKGGQKVNGSSLTPPIPAAALGPLPRGLPPSGPVPATEEPPLRISQGGPGEVTPQNAADSLPEEPKPTVIPEKKRRRHRR